MSGSHGPQGNTDVFQFCDKHGQNVYLANGKKSALWAQRCFDGKCFVKEPLSTGGSVTLKLSGSGSILLGLADRRPKPSEIHDVKNRLLVSTNCVYLQPLDMHKQKNFTVSFSRERSREVKVICGNDRVHTVKSGNSFVVLGLLFGDLVVQLESDDGKDYKFDETHGPNICCSTDFTTVCLLNAYGQALCAVGRAIGTREIIHLVFNPVDEARLCHMTTYLSNKSPTREDAYNMERRMRSRMKFKMRGSVQLCLQDGDARYTFDGREKPADVRDLDLTAPVFLYIQLFRVRVDVRSEQEPPTVSAGSSRCVVDGASADTRFSDLIQSNYVYLKEVLDPDPLADHLLGDHKMPPAKAEEFRELRHRKQKCEMVLHILMVDPTTEGTFIKAMKYPEHPQTDILRQLGLFKGATSRGGEV